MQSIETTSPVTILVPTLETDTTLITETTYVDDITLPEVFNDLPEDASVEDAIVSVDKDDLGLVVVRLITYR